MNYIKCFSRSRSAKNLQTVFCLCARLVSPLASGKEYCHGCTFAPVWCPRWHQARSIATAAHLRPSGVPVGIRQEVLPRLHICARLASRRYQVRSIATDAHLRSFRVSIPSYYTHYSKLEKLEFWQWCPLLAARYRLYRVSQILGNCKQM